MRLLSNLYYYLWQGMGNNCNSYLIAGKKLTLIDPGHITNEYGEPCLEMLKSSMKKDGFNIDDVELILITHAHPDHFESAPIINKGKAKIAIYNNNEGYGKLAHSPMGKLMGLKQIDIKPDTLLNDGDTLDLGDISLQVIHTPGHSPESMCLYWPESKVLFTGDVIFMVSVGRTDFPGGNTKLLKESIDKISELDIEYLLPGHMDIVTGQTRVRRNIDFVKNNFFGE
jgi:hydroxyacylglutathione hydrolase